MERRRRGFHQTEEWHELAALFSPGSLCAAPDIKAVEQVLSGSTLSLPVLLPSHLTCTEDSGLLLPSPLQGAQDDGDNQTECKQLAVESLPLAFADHARVPGMPRGTRNACGCGASSHPHSPLVLPPWKWDGLGCVLPLLCLPAT